MKKLTCRDLGGACDEEITANSIEELGNNCKAHVIEKLNSGDEAHQAAVEKMQNASPEEQKSMLSEFAKKFNETPEI